MRPIVALLAVMIASPTLAAEPFARASVADGHFVPGEQVFVTIDVFVPDFFTSPPQFPLFDIPNALVTLPDERAQNLTQTIDGVQYSGIRRRYAIVPESPGEFGVPPISVAFGYSSAGRTIKGAVNTSPLEFSVGHAAAGASFVASGLTVTQSFDRDPATLHTGDAIVRTIVVTASGTQALLLPPVDVGQASGLQQYVKLAKVEDGVSVGRDVVSRRTEAITYVAPTEGHFTLPAVSYRWLDIDHQTLADASLPAMAVAVAPGAAKAGILPRLEPQRTKTAHERRREIAIGILALLAFAALIWIGRRLPEKVLTLLRQTRERILASRGYRLRVLKRTIRSAPMPTVYAAIQAWSRSEGYRTLHDWSAGTKPETKVEIGNLEALLFGKTDRKVDRNRLAEISSFRMPATTTRDHHRLPPLNPAGDSERQ